MKSKQTPSTAQEAAIESAESVGLRYVSDNQPGIKRLKSGKTFRYIDSDGKPVRDDACLKRIRSLVIPPAWTDVWICSKENGHLQATGRDIKGRKQNRYHRLWREVRDTTKYDRMVTFGKALPKIRARIAHDIMKSKLVREKVLATIIRLMDLTFIRVGNREYAKANKSYGLTTMRDRHAKIRGETVRFSFRGKSGKEHTIDVEDRRIARIMKRCQDIPGQDLFQYYNNDGQRHNVTSGDVNAYLGEISGADFTAKDFRTWAGTVLAAEALKAAPPMKSQRQAKRAIQQAILAVAERLGNTPAVCRKCYIHPLLLESYLKGALARSAKPTNGIGSQMSSRATRALVDSEKEVLRFLCRCRAGAK